MNLTGVIGLVGLSVCLLAARMEAMVLNEPIEIEKSSNRTQRACRPCLDCCSAKSVLSNIRDECIRNIGNLEITTLSSGRYYFGDFELSWFEAVSFCRQHGMELAALESKTEFDAVGKFINKINTKRFAGYWLGGNSLATRGHYIWSNSGDPFTYTNWDLSQSDDQEGEWRCVEISSGLLSTFVYACWARQCVSFVCEVPQPCATLLNDRFSCAC